MTPFTTHTAASAGQQGGSSRSPAKLKHLRRLHRSRRGKKQSSDPARLIAQVNHALANSGGSWTQVELAKLLSVSPHTIGRWLHKGHWPRPAKQKQLADWLASKNFHTVANTLNQTTVLLRKLGF